MRGWPRGVGAARRRAAVGSAGRGVGRPCCPRGASPDGETRAAPRCSVLGARASSAARPPSEKGLLLGWVSSEPCPGSARPRRALTRLGAPEPRPPGPGSSAADAAPPASAVARAEVARAEVARPRLLGPRRFVSGAESSSSSLSPLSFEFEAFSETAVSGGRHPACGPSEGAQCPFSSVWVTGLGTAGAGGSLRPQAGGGPARRPDSAWGWGRAGPAAPGAAPGVGLGSGGLGATEAPLVLPLCVCSWL